MNLSFSATALAVFPCTLLGYTGRDGSFNLYEDGDTTYNYEKGAFSNINFTYNGANKKLTIEERKGSFKNMLDNRVFKIVWISKTEPKELEFDNAGAQLIEYRGKEDRSFKEVAYKCWNRISQCLLTEIAFMFRGQR